MKVIHLITGLTVGGAEQMLLRTVPKLTGEHVVCSIIPRAKIGEELEKLNVPVYYLNLRHFFDIRVVFKCYKLLRQNKPDILITYLLHADILGRIIGKCARVPIIISSIRAHQERKALLTIIKYTRFLVNYYIVVSETVKQWAIKRLKLDHKKIHVIYNGLLVPPIRTQNSKQTAKQRLKIPEQAITLSYVGRLDNDKGTEYLITALSKLKPLLNQPFLCLIVGDGPNRISIEKQIQTLGLTNYVHCLGVQRDVATIYEATDIFVSPTLSEGMSNAIMEAMSYGLPIITTDISENRELINHAKHGILVQTKDSNTLAEALYTLCINPEIANKLGQEARKKIEEKFAIDTTITQLNNLLQHVYVRNRR